MTTRPSRPLFNGPLYAHPPPPPLLQVQIRKGTNEGKNRISLRNFPGIQSSDINRERTANFPGRNSEFLRKIPLQRVPYCCCCCCCIVFLETEEIAERRSSVEV
ncbi:hypothetical protein NL676_000122 [Syzygium grande]|nr:hypothetical protein NL676_000122 [Syzygium grande]